MNNVAEHTDAASQILSSALTGKTSLPIAPAVTQNAQRVLEKYGIPEVKNEKYKYANVAEVLNEGNFSAVLPVASLDKAWFEGIFPSTDNILVTLNGETKQFKAENSFSLTDISDYLAVQPSVSFDENDAMQALAILTAHNGFYLKVQGKASKPLVWFNILTAETPNYHASLNAITVAAETEAEIIEIRIGKNAAVFANQLTQVITREGSNFRISVTDHALNNSSGVFSVQTLQEKASTFSHDILATGGAFVRQNLTVEHTGENCHTELNGFYTADEKRHQDFSTIVKHNIPNCTSDELYKGVAAGNSKAIFNGKVYVARDAQKTSAFQSNKNILLSENALIRSKPELEIYADDVKCSHGSTTGQTDTKSLFYLRARGIREKEAKKMLMLAFAGDVLERIPNEETRTFLGQIAEEKLQVIV